MDLIKKRFQNSNKEPPKEVFTTLMKDPEETETIRNLLRDEGYWGGCVGVEEAIVCSLMLQGQEEKCDLNDVESSQDTAPQEDCSETEDEA